MAVTIKDIAAAAGVSPSTVSRTCKDSPSISRDTKERVRRIMAQLGYEPNFEAEPVEAFSKTIGIILPSSQRDVYENAFHLEIIRGIGQFCNQRRYVNTVITGAGRCRGSGRHPEHGGQRTGRWLYPALLQKGLPCGGVSAQ